MSDAVLAVGLITMDVFLSAQHCVSPPPGEIRAIPLTVQSGGMAATFARDLARLGQKVYLAGPVGTDAAAAGVLSAIREDGVEVSAVQRLPGKTPITLVVVHPSGERSFLSEDGVASRWSLASLSLPSDAVHVHLGGIPLHPAVPWPEVEDFLAEANKKGVTVSMDPIYLPDAPWQLLRRLLPHLDYVFPSAAEARLLTGEDDPAAAALRISSEVRRAAVVKLGADGALLAVDGSLTRIPALPVPCVDATGAGEAFAAGFVYAHLAGATYEEAARFAAACGALCVTEVGGPTALRSAAKVRAWADLLDGRSRPNADGPSPPHPSKG